MASVESRRPGQPRTHQIRHLWLFEQITAVRAATRHLRRRRVQAEQVLGRGVAVAHDAVEMLMRRAGLKGPAIKRRYTSARPFFTGAPDHGRTPTRILRI